MSSSKDLLTKMKIDLKVVFLVFAVFCQLYLVDGWWSSRRSSGSGRRSTSIRTQSTRRTRWWSRRTPSSSTRTPSSRRTRWWSRRTPSSSTRTPSSRRTGWWSRRTPSSSRTPSSRRNGWWFRRTRSTATARIKATADRGPVPKTKATLGPLQTSHGQMTFDAEGNDIKGSRYFSREPHVPTGSSGITLGRGYDMKEKKKDKVYKDLVSAGIEKKAAKKFSEGAGLRGDAAEIFLKNNGIQNFQINHKQQKKLFEISYKEEAAGAKRIATKADVQAKYGKTDWDNLNGAIKNTVIDLKFRGDYKPETRKKIQAAIASNDLKKFTQLMSDKDYWVKKFRVPEARFDSRKAALEKAVKDNP